MEIVAVDLGYGYVKGVSEKGKSILFPTLIGPGHGRSLASLFGANGKDYGNLHVRVQGNDYFIGELARESRSTSRVFDSERYHHPYTRILMNAAISLLAEEHSDDGLYRGQDPLQASVQSILANIADRLKTAWGPAMDLFDRALRKSAMAFLNMFGQD